MAEPTKIMQAAVLLGGKLCAAESSGDTVVYDFGNRPKARLFAEWVGAIHCYQTGPIELQGTAGRGYTYRIAVTAS
jgi:hypothetical protein